MEKRIPSILFALSIIAALASGCGKSESAGGTPKDGEVKPAATIEIPPTTLKITANMTDEVFQYMITDPLSKKYPQITVVKQKGTIPDLIAAGETPDLITDWNGGVPSQKQNDVLADMTPTIKKHNFDLSRFQDVYINAIKVASDKGELFAIPYYAQVNALYYNKNIFDKFGVSYPKDGMTWDDAIEQAKKLTRMENGVQIQGLNYGGVQRLAFPFTPDIVSAKTEKPTVNNEVWKRAFETALRNDQIPGNYPGRDFNKGEVAMFAGIGDSLPGIKTAAQQGFISLGVAQYPQFKEAPNTYGMVDAHYMFITKTSKNKDAAMKVIEVLTSDEVQLAGAKTYARLSTLKNPEMQKQFGKDYLPGVDLQSIFKSKPAAGATFSELYPKGRDIVLDEYKNVATAKKDINTAIRDSEDRITKLVADSKAAK